MTRRLLRLMPISMPILRRAPSDDDQGPGRDSGLSGPGDRRCASARQRVVAGGRADRRVRRCNPGAFTIRGPRAGGVARLGGPCRRRPGAPHGPEAVARPWSGGAHRTAPWGGGQHQPGTARRGRPADEELVARCGSVRGAVGDTVSSHRSITVVARRSTPLTMSSRWSRQGRPPSEARGRHGFAPVASGSSRRRPRGRWTGWSR